MNTVIPLAKRIEQVRRSLTKHHLDSLLVTNQCNISYLTEITHIDPVEPECILLLTKKNMYIFVFSTSKGMFTNSRWYQIKELTMTTKLRDHLHTIAAQENLNIVGYEKENITIAFLQNLKKVAHIRWEGTQDIVETLRKKKDIEEVARISQAARITDLAFEYIQTKILTGITEWELALELEYFMKRIGDGIAFRPIVAYNKHAAIPHHVPSKDTSLQKQTLILLDFGAKVDGYCSDMTRVVFYGKPTNEQKKCYETVLEAQNRALNIIKPGVKACDVDAVSRAFIKDTRYPEFSHGLGHSVGLAIHEGPRLRPGQDDILQENMVVTVEPGVYIPGKFGIRIEDLVLLKKDGIEILSKSTKEIIVL